MPLQKSKRKKISPKTLITGLIVFLMVSSILGIISNRNSDESGRLEYNGYDFSLVNNRWQVKVDGQTYTFDYHPTELENLNVSPQALAKIITSPIVYFTFDPGWKDSSYLDLLRLQFDTTIPAKYGIQFVSAVTTNETVVDYKGREISYDLPIVTCQDAGGMVPVIYAVESNETSMLLDGQCIVMSVSSGNDLWRMRDRILYTYLGIMV